MFKAGAKRKEVLQIPQWDVGPKPQGHSGEKLVRFQ
jgi:hypothetical protein